MIGKIKTYTFSQTFCVIAE